MVVLVLESVPPGLRGEITRWMLEVKTGVFVGQVSALVREKLWQKACANSRGGRCLIVHSTNNEQGYSLRSFGDPDRELVDYDGLTLVRVLGHGISPGPAGAVTSTLPGVGAALPGDGLMGSVLEPESGLESESDHQPEPVAEGAAETQRGSTPDSPQ